MGVNFIADKAATQEMSVALSQGMLLNELNRAMDQERTQDGRQTDRAEEQSDAGKLAEGKKAPSKLTKELIQNLTSNVASSGIKLADGITNKMNRQIQDEYDLMFESSSGSIEDAADLSKQVLAIGAKNHRHGKQQQGQQDPNLMNDPSLKETLVEYKSAYAQFVLNGGTELKKKIEQLESKLREQGLSNKDLLSLQTNLKNSVRGEIASQIKDQYLKRLLSGEKGLDRIINSKALNQVLGFAEHCDELGGWNFGGFMDNLQGVMDRQAREVQGEVRDFIQDELEQKLVEKHLSKNNPDFDAKKAEQQFKELLELGMKIGFKPEEFLANWKDKSDNLIGFIPQDQNVGTESGLGDSKHKQPQGFDYTQEDEKEMLINQLRALYMQRAVKGSLMTTIGTSFKIRKLKNGLIKLGISFEDFDKIEKEGYAVAKVRSMEMLKDFLYERATLYELSGPAFDLIKRKIKTALRNLERLGSPIGDLEFDNLRDEANYRMFEVARFELENTIILYEKYRDPNLEKKAKLLIKLMGRLKEESKIETDFDPELRFSSVQSAA